MPSRIIEGTIYILPPIDNSPIRMYDINDLIRDVCTIYMTWSETYVRYKWPDQSRMYDINDLIRDVCTIYMTWSEMYVRYTWPDQRDMHDSWSWSYDSWIYNYLCNQCLSPLNLWVRTPLMARCTQYNIMWLSLSVTCDRSVVFSGYFLFPPPLKLTATI
jgi:hypothetical protein